MASKKGKRKFPGDHDPQKAAKKQKGETSKNAGGGDSGSKGPVEPKNLYQVDDRNPKKIIHWVVTGPNQFEYEAKYSQTLLGDTIQIFHNSQTAPLEPSRVAAPTRPKFKSIALSGKRFCNPETALAYNDGTASLEALWKSVEADHHAHQQSSNTRSRIEAAIVALGADDALVAFEEDAVSDSTQRRPYNRHVVSSDTRVEFDVDKTTRASFDIIRRQSTGNNDIAERGFFIRVGDYTPITVNGQTFRVPGSQDGSSSDEPLYIGPLEDFTTIEYRAHAFLFWRRAADLTFDIDKRRPSEEEMGRRGPEFRGKGKSRKKVYPAARKTWTNIAGDKPGDDSCEKSGEKPGEEPGEELGEKTGEKPVEQPVEQQVEQPVRTVTPKTLQDIPMDFSANSCSRLPGELRKSKKRRATPDKGTFDQGGLELLDLEQVVLAIASVVLAINKPYGPIDRGFGILLSRDINSCLIPEDKRNLDPVIQFGRPLLVPIYKNGHFVLFILQLNKKQSPTLSIVDSRPWHYDRQEREQIYGACLAILKRSQWWRNIFKDTSSYAEPAYATWRGCARQQDLWMSGDYAILNAWALALGLKLKRDFKPEPDFNDKARQLIRLAVSGNADMDLIVAFLLGRKFAVLPEGNSIAPSRRFAKTVDLQDPATLAKELMDWRNAVDGQLANTGSDMRFSEVSMDDSIVFSKKTVRHTASFASDTWTYHTRHRRFEKLLQCGKGDINRTNGQVIEDFIRLADPSRNPQSPKLRSLFANLLQQRGLDIGTIFPPSLPNYLPQISKTELKLYNQDKCKYYRTQMGIYSSLRNDIKDRIRDFDEQQAKSMRAPSLPRWGAYPQDDTINLAMASVLEAINELQQPLDPDGRGGLALHTSANYQLAMTGYGAAAGEISRPRRCWFMPVTIAGPVMDDFATYCETQKDVPRKRIEGFRQSAESNTGHYMLAVVQEHQGTFHVRFLDSMPDYTVGKYSWWYRRIQAAADSLGWSTHRNTGQNGEAIIVWADHCESVRVLPQTQNWVCGYHTVVSTWILAMGLTINHSKGGKKLSGDFYKEVRKLIKCAVEGLVDWRTLHAFFLCYELCTPDSTVPANRQFERTHRQTTDERLGVRLEPSVRSGARLRMQPMDTHPYDHSCNVDFQAHGDAVELVLDEESASARVSL
ncbi:hypothetical protein GQ43DRAFT_99157 [Delitschia confertaspora ATCC 74209]|uniref:Ubiquitin-like protease family profile domain-containing protein n=1 Tax=Delitschia confertaspora ATCC 74209 TaxID=1513339 RepID=A0A9P4MNU8_9PLEO|nr:hypothetical protein GQ43DRAFT_99157 [Delitschia confertaspora ATCC 74209]